MSELTGRDAFEFLFEQYESATRRIGELTAQRDETRNDVLGRNETIRNLEAELRGAKRELDNRRKGDHALHTLIWSADQSAALIVTGTTDDGLVMTAEKIAGLRALAECIKAAAEAAKPHDPDPIPF